MDLPFSAERVHIPAEQQQELHPDARAALSVEIETATVLKDPKIQVLFSGPVLVVTLVSTDLTKGCRISASASAAALQISFRHKTLPPGAVISFTAYSEAKVSVESVLTTGYTVH
jgi:hypothetical protein